MTLVAGELRKLLTTRTVLWFALASVVLALVNAVLVGLASGTLDEVGEKEEALGGMPLLLLFFGVVAVAGEYRHHTAAPAVLASGRDRGVVGLARLVAHVVIGLALAALTTGTAFAAGVPLLAAYQVGPDLTGAQLVPLAAGCVAAGVCSVLLGAAIGALLRNRIAALVVAVVVYFVAPPLVGKIDESTVDYLPFGSLQVLTRGVHGATHIAVPTAGLALAGWAVAAAVVAVVVERHRDLV